MILKIALFVFVLLLALVFSYFNLQSVKVSFFGGSVTLPLFLVVFISFVVGFLIAYISSELKALEWRRYGERLKKALTNLWTGYPDRARSQMEKLLDNEEVVPLYAESMKELGKEASVYLQRYSGGIVETVIAQYVFREERDRAKDLLEKALGKNWNNLKARRLLRSIYFLDGEGDKAVDLQRSIVQDSEKALKDVEKEVLSSMLASLRGEETLEELTKLPLTPTSLAFLIGLSQKHRERYISRMFEEGIANETLLVLVQNNSLTPEVIEVVERRREEIDPVVLSLMYASVGMYERLEQLKDKLPLPIKILIEKGYGEDRECYRELVPYIRLLECSLCGKEYPQYSPICPNCLGWNKLKVKGGSKNAH